MKGGYGVGCVDILTVTFGNRRMTVEVARQYAKDRKELSFMKERRSIRRSR